MIGSDRYRTHTCVGAAHAGGTVRVAGWVHRRRDHGGLIFVDLRDRSGIVQLVFDPEAAPEAHAAAHRFHNEDVVSVVGAVTARDAKNVNPNIATGAVEVRVEQVELLSAADPLPFSVEDESQEASEEIRLTYRYIETRRPRRLRALELRARIARATRRVLDAEGFLEVETPILIRSTPEGARDFIVPSRLQQGKWYALPQSPQLFKQLLMVGGSSATTRSSGASATRIFGPTASRSSPRSTSRPRSCSPTTSSGSSRRSSWRRPRRRG